MSVSILDLEKYDFLLTELLKSKEKLVVNGECLLSVLNEDQKEIDKQLTTLGLRMLRANYQSYDNRYGHLYDTNTIKNDPIEYNFRRSTASYKRATYKCGECDPALAALALLDAYEYETSEANKNTLLHIEKICTEMRLIFIKNLKDYATARRLAFASV